MFRVAQEDHKGLKPGPAVHSWNILLTGLVSIMSSSRNGPTQIRLNASKAGEWWRSSRPHNETAEWVWERCGSWVMDLAAASCQSNQTLMGHVGLMMQTTFSPTIIIIWEWLLKAFQPFSRDPEMDLSCPGSVWWPETLHRHYYFPFNSCAVLSRFIGGAESRDMFL